MVARVRAAAATLRSCTVITAEAVATANELLDSLSALPDLAEVTEELATLADFYLRFSDVVASDNPVLAHRAHENALHILAWLTAYDIDAVPRAVASRFRMLALDDPTNRHLAALEAIAERATREHRPDQEVLLRIGELRWSKFLHTSGGTALSELMACTEAYESAAELGDLSAPAEIVDYLSHLRLHVDPPQILLRWWRQRRHRPPPGAVGRRIILLRRRFRRLDDPLLIELAGCHLTRFGDSGHPDDLEAAVSIAAPLVGTASSVEVMLRARLVLMGALVLRDDIGSASRLLEEAITAYDENVSASLRREWLDAASIIAALTEDRSVIDAVATRLRSAIDELGHRSPATARLWIQRAVVMRRRFDLTGRLRDLVEAIRDARTATRRDPGAPEPREYLAFWMFDRYQLTGNVEDLRASVDLLRKLYVEGGLSPQGADDGMEIILTASTLDAETLTTLADGFRKMTRGANAGLAGRWWLLLALVLTRLDEATGNHRHADEAIDAARHALVARRVGTEADGPTQRMINLLLATSLSRRGRPDDAQEAIRLLRDLIEKEDRSIAAKRHRTRLAAILLETRAGHDEDVIRLLRPVADDPASPAADRTDAAYLLAKAAAAAGQFALAVDSYRTTVDLLAAEARQPLEPDDRREQEQRWFGAAEDGAACALALNRPESALSLLEQGRGVRIGQTLQLREQLRWLRAHRPDLAEEMVPLVDAIQAYGKGMSGEIPRDFIEAFGSTLAIAQERVRAMFSGFDLASHTTAEAFMQQRERLSEELSSEVLSEDTRYEIAARWEDFELKVRRAVPDEPWRLRTDVSTLLAAVPDGHAVVINISRLGCAALIVGDGRVTTVDLPRLKLEDIDKLARRMMLATLSVQSGHLSKGDRTRLADTFTEVQAWLWDSVAEPVLKEIHPFDREPYDEPPRIWWVPTGLLAMLPLHAAGRPGGPYVLDRVVSSYTTTLGMLQYARRDHRPSNEEPRMLAVAVSEIDGAATLRYAAQELAELDPWLTSSLKDAEATINSVAGQLPGHDRVHFVCHGTPSAGGRPAQLYLSNNVLTVNRLGWLTPVDAELAYLSACHSANASPRDVGAGDHLAAAFQAAGYRHVIGTLWGAADHVGPQVAADFYRELARVGSPARALHHAVRRLRDAYPNKPSIWAPFVHLGP
ncbi:CHAT domain-containing protein [Micromonospora echinospora]|uniref:CHAT domain-containing protein n=1 Tax=Micromonospora echinospora TaxID=1877 RepID=UPI003CED6F2A